MNKIPLKPLSELTEKGKRIVSYLKSLGYPVNTYNIVYLEGINPDLETLNADRLDEWNDVRTVVGHDGQVYLSSTATSELGKFYTNNPMNSDGGARIAFGFYEGCWSLGYHFKQKALVQVDNIKVYRDFNKDGKRTGDKVYTGLFAINQHTTGNNSSAAAPDTIDHWSAGCLVGKHASTHYDKFIPACEAIAGKNSGYRFDTYVLDGSLFAKYV